MPECNDYDCNDTLKELELFLDKELSDDVRQTIHHHLERCPHCLQAFDFHAELRSVIATKCNNDEMPPGLLLKIERCFGDELGADLIAKPNDLDAGGRAD